jgi:putative toxin-antitoxin system antitoxin component (TIGR02293 family)
MAVSARAQNSLSRLLDYLGGRAVFRTTIRTRLDLVPLVRAGLPYAALEAVGSRLHVTPEAAATSLLLPLRTLARRKTDGKLDAYESERVVRLADVAARAGEVLGEDNVARWLMERNQALGGAPPIEMLDTDLGCEAVKDILGRIEHGVFS